MRSNIWLVSSIALVLLGTWLAFRYPRLDVVFPEYSYPDRQMKVVSLDPAAEKQIQSLISAAKQDPEQWYALDTFVSHLADTSLVRHSPIKDLRYTTRIPAGSYLLFSPDKGNAFIKLVDLKSDTVLTLTMDDHVSN